MTADTISWAIFGLGMYYLRSGDLKAAKAETDTLVAMLTNGLYEHRTDNLLAGNRVQEEKAPRVSNLERFPNRMGYQRTTAP